MWQSVTACAIIQLTGAGQEKLLNRLTQDGIGVWGVRRRADGSTELWMRADDFRSLHRLRRGLHCRIRVIEKRGLAFPLLRLFRRRTLWIGAILAVALLTAASTRIWRIEIRGCSRVAEQTVLRALAGEGVAIGAPNTGYDVPRMDDALRTCDERIAWIGLDFDGVILRVEVEETVPGAVLPDLSEPADVVAQKAGLIVSVTASRGRAAVQPGDAVEAGDLLIAGDLTREDSQTPLHVRASGIVTANVAYVSEAVAGPETTEWTDTGRKSPFRAVTLAGICVFESAVPYADYELRDCLLTRLTGAVLPLSVLTGVCYEREERPAVRTEQEMGETALAQAERGAYLRIPKDARIVDKQSNWMMLDGCAAAVVTIITEETIGLTKEKTFDGFGTAGTADATGTGDAQHHTG